MPDLHNIGVSGLLAFQRSLSTTGHNIANSDTVGYSRQRTLLGTQTPQLTGVGWLGSGVKVTDIERSYDDFLATQVRSAQSTASELESYFDHASRMDNILADPNIGLDPAIQGFFDAMQLLADDPSSMPSRQQLLSETQSMVDRFHDLNLQFNDMRDQLNQELAGVTEEINGLAQSIARVNQNIVEAIGASGSGGPNDLFDEREVLLNQLSERVDISIVPQDDGAWNVFIGKGQALVIGSAPATLSTQPGADEVNRHDVTFTTRAGSQVITSQLAGGEIGGLLSFRSQILDPAQNQLGLVAVGVSDRVNAQHQLGLDLHGALGGSVFSDPSIGVIPNNGNSSAVSVSASMLDSGSLTASDYELESGGGGLFTLTRRSDSQSFAINTGGVYPHTTAAIDGFNLAISGAAAAGDRFLVQPTRDAAEQITLLINDPARFAAAAPLRAQPGLNANTGSGNGGSGSITQPSAGTLAGLPLGAGITLTFDAAGSQFNVDLDGNLATTEMTLAYNPATQSAGAPFTIPGFGDAAFSFRGVPADGDRFVIQNNSGGVGDNRNALAMAGIQATDSMLSGTSTLQETYAQLVSSVGSKTHQAEVNMQSTQGLLERHQMSLSSISGVNLDEEAANLIKYQQAYQATAQVISVASTLFDTLIGAVRR